MSRDRPETIPLGFYQQESVIELREEFLLTDFVVEQIDEFFQFMTIMNMTYVVLPHLAILLLFWLISLSIFIRNYPIL